MLPTLWEQFGDGPFLFQRDCAPVHKDECAGLSGSSTPNSKIPINTLLTLVQSLPRRVEAVRAADGGPTSYSTYGSGMWWVEGERRILLVVQWKHCCISVFWAVEIICLTARCLSVESVPRAWSVFPLQNNLLVDHQVGTRCSTPVNVLLFLCNKADEQNLTLVGIISKEGACSYWYLRQGWRLLYWNFWFLHGPLGLSGNVTAHWASTCLCFILLPVLTSPPEWWWQATGAHWRRRTCGLWTLRTAPTESSHSWSNAGTHSAKNLKGQERDQTSLYKCRLFGRHPARLTLFPLHRSEEKLLYSSKRVPHSENPQRQAVEESEILILRPRKKNKEPSLLWALCLTFGPYFFISCIYKLIQDILMFVGPEILRWGNCRPFDKMTLSRWSVWSCIVHLSCSRTLIV